MIIKNYKGRIEIKPGKYAYVPAKDSRANAKRIAREIRNRWKPPSYCCHLARGGHLWAIDQHLENSYFARLDIENFFPSINKNKLVRSLKKIGYSFADATEIATVSTVVYENEKILPYGFIQSPILATLVLSKSAIGQAIDQGMRAGAHITVYVDDILISSKFEEVTWATFEKVRAGIVTAGFSVNDGKTLQPSEKTEAFNIEISRHTRSIAELRMTRFRERIHFPSSREQTIHYVELVNEKQADELREIAEKIDSPSVRSTTAIDKDDSN